MKNKNYKKITLFHTISSILIAVIFFYFYEQDFARAFFYGSLAFNLYVRLLSLNFSVLAVPGENEDVSGKYSLILGIFSGLRTALLAGVLAVFILKFKLNLYALATAFFLFQVILIASGIYFNRVVPKL